MSRKAIDELMSEFMTINGGTPDQFHPHVMMSFLFNKIAYLQQRILELERFKDREEDIARFKRENE